MRSLLVVLFSLASPLAGPSLAQAHQTISAGQAFAVDTTPGMANAAGYVDLMNGGESPAQLTGVSFGPSSQDLAQEIQLHTHIQDGDLMRMAEIPAPLVIAPGEGLTMAPGGIHIMLLGLNQPLEAGTMVEVVLHLEGEHTRDLTVEIPVLSADEVPLSKMMSTDDHQGHGEHEGHSGHEGHASHEDQGEDKKHDDAGDHSGHNH